MAMKTRENALFNAYLNNYKAAQAQAVNSGVQATQAARQRGAALLNATDKTLPVLKNQLADVGTAAITGANNDFKLAQQAAAMANDQFTKNCRMTPTLLSRSSMKYGTLQNKPKRQPKPQNHPAVPRAAA